LTVLRPTPSTTANSRLVGIIVPAGNSPLIMAERIAAQSWVYIGVGELMFTLILEIASGKCA
jgi:hypothetical protein